MKKRRGRLAGALALALSCVLTAQAAAKTRADCEREYTPQRGQDGKDVIWVPTEDGMVTLMLQMAELTSADKLYDLGAGDGKIAIAAARDFGATAIGVEYDPDLARHAQCLVEAEGVEDRVTIVQGDIFETDFSDATVVALYLLPDLNRRLRPTLLAMPPGTRVVSYSFGMGEWDPDGEVQSDDGVSYLWIVPANVEGRWTFQSASGDEAFDVTLEQRFQKVRGARRGERLRSLQGRLRGERIELEFTEAGQPVRFTGIVSGNRISGTLVRNGAEHEYFATRE